MKKKKKETSDYYYLSNRKRVEVLFSSRVSLTFYFRESFKRTSFSSLACVSDMVLGLKTGIKLVLQSEGKLKKIRACKKSNRNY